MQERESETEAEAEDKEESQKGVVESRNLGQVIQHLIDVHLHGLTQNRLNFAGRIGLFVSPFHRSRSNDRASLETARRRMSAF